MSEEVAVKKKKKNKIKVHYVGGMIGEPKAGQMWGGTMATNYTIQQAFKKSKKYKLVMKQRTEFQTPEEVKKFLDKGKIGWLDETSLLQQQFSMGYDRPDLIGPISRSPIKNYNAGNWQSVYNPTWFYSGHVLRLNENEEKEQSMKLQYKGSKDGYLGKVDFIRHGIDTDRLRPSKKAKKFVLWAGNAARPAKNFDMWKDIKQYITASRQMPLGYEIRQMSGYTIDQYWDVLDETAVYVCTSLYESFCCAANEARAKGVPVIVRDFLTGTIMYTDQPIQCTYAASDFGRKIIQLCRDKEMMAKESDRARKWVLKNCSLEVMRKDIEKVFDQILKEKRKSGRKRKTS